MTTTDADVDSKKTILGVGIATLLAPLMRSSNEPTIVIASDLAREIATTPVATTARIQTTARSERTASPDMSRRRKLAVVIVGTVALSIAAGEWIRSREAAPDAHASLAAAVAEVPVVAPTATTPSLTPAPEKPDVDSTPVASASSDRARAVALGAGSCSLVLDSRLAGDAFVNEQSVGRTPVTVTGLWCGRSTTVRIARQGYVAWSRTLTTQEGQTSRLLASLRRPAPPTTPDPTPPIEADHVFW